MIWERVGNDIICRYRGSLGERDFDDIYVRSKKIVGFSLSEVFKLCYMLRIKMNWKVKEVVSRVLVGDIEVVYLKRLFIIWEIICELMIIWIIWRSDEGNGGFVKNNVFIRVWRVSRCCGLEIRGKKLGLIFISRRVMCFL